MPKPVPSPRVLLVAVPVVGLALAVMGCPPPPAAQPSREPGAERTGAGEYLFCFWNVENFFDDKVDHRTNEADQEYDEWFGKHPDVFRRKLGNLAEVLCKLKGGKGPDIVALAEVEDRRAADLLARTLNQELDNPDLEYKNVLMEEVDGGRHIAPAILSRLPVQGNRTHLLGKRLRILEGHITVEGHDLVVIASHWTSRVSSKEDREGAGRDKYAEEIYGRFHSMYRANPQVDLLVCGDFNDDPTDESVGTYLHATDKIREVRPAAGERVEEPLLLDLMLGKDPDRFGTHNYKGHWHIFDQIAVSPGMLDDTGWSCDPSSVHTVNELTADRKGHPRDFGSPGEDIPLKERGYSDHFPVTVRLDVEKK
jgi:endonuclease/exonuclease/phosphatase family metal-dependent hydrolase